MNFDEWIMYEINRERLLRARVILSDDDNALLRELNNEMNGVPDERL